MALRYVVVVLLLVAAGCGGGGAAAESPGPRLYFAGDGELWILDAATGRVQHRTSTQLKPGDWPHRVLARGRRVIMGTPYGDSAYFLPSARPDRVWVVDLSPVTGLVRAVREVTVDGETTVPAAEPPGRRRPLGAVDDGLLLEAGNGVDVWDPATGRVVHHLRPATGIIGSATGNVVTGCTDVWCGNLRLIDVDTGAARVVRAPEFIFEPWHAEFSPDGEVLAIPLREFGPLDAPRHLALIQVATGRLAVIPGSRVPAGYTLVAWSASGRHVFLTGGDDRRVLVGYRMGTRRAQALDVDLGPFYDLAAI